MLAGVGGGTVAHAGQAITVDEMGRWAQYEREHGSLDHVKRIEERLDFWFARICMLMVNRTGGWSKGKAASMDDFLPPKRALESEPEPSTIGGVDPGLAALIAATGAKRSKGK